MKRLMSIVGAVLFAAAGCDGGSTKGSTHEDETGSGDSHASFTAFVIDLIDAHTVDDTAPVSFSEFESLPDPDAESNNLDAYQSLF